MTAPMQTEAQTRSLHDARRWLWIGVAALALAGLLAVVLVLARTPLFASIDPLKQAFHRSLVVHVDLSVLVWFLASACMLWSAILSFGREAHRRGLPYAAVTARWSFLGGTVLLALSPLGGGVPLMSNYIPVITNPLFFTGLGLILAGTLVSMLEALTAVATSRNAPVSLFPLPSAPVQFAVFSSMGMVLLACVAFYLSALALGGMEKDEAFYDTVFWGGGHLLQFAWTQLLLLVWWLLATACGMRINQKLVWALLILGCLPLLLSPLAYLLYDVDSFGHRYFFTVLMRWGNGAATAIMGLWLVWHLLYQRTKYVDAYRSALIFSLALFLVGGVFGLLIVGEDVRVPAHYHGSIVGVTLAFMGMSYWLLPRFGYADVSRWRMACWQPLLSGGGQLLHITGLAWSGGYGVARKTPGELEGGLSAAKAAMGLMGLGGLFAILGGVLFVLVVFKAWRKAEASIYQTAV